MNKLEKTLLSAIAVLMTFSINSIAAANFTGPYIGAVAGYNYVPIDYKSYSIEYPATTERTYHLNGPVGGIELGYGYVIKNNYYVGIDFIGLLNNVNSTETFAAATSSQKLELTQKNHYGSDLHLGYILQDNILLYGLAGYSQGYFDAKERNVIGSTFDRTCEKTATLSGLDLGVGAKFSVFSHISIDAKYTYTNYNSFSQRVAVSATSNQNDQYLPKSHLFTLGLFYIF